MTKLDKKKLIINYSLIFRIIRFLSLKFNDLIIIYRSTVLKFFYLIIQSLIYVYIYIYIIRLLFLIIMLNIFNNF